MMDKVRMFGFPIEFDSASDKLVPGNENVTFEAYNRKFSKAMFGLLADKQYQKEDEAYYDFYRAIGNEDEKKEFENANLRYDSTVIMAGKAGDEYKKTAGHFHCEVPGKGMSYPEYYQVCKGTALFVMQKVADPATEGRMVVEDCILAVVKEGEAIVVPPDYGHCTVNIGDETMVFVNLVSVDSSNSYDSVKRSVGMCCYIKDNGTDGFTVEKNANYDFSCEPRIVTPNQSDALGIYNDAPVYNVFLANPERFQYLNAPENNMKDYFHVFK